MVGRDSSSHGPAWWTFVEGSTFWFIRKTLSGSYLSLIATRRRYLSVPNVLLTRALSTSLTKFSATPAASARRQPRGPLKGADTGRSRCFSGLCSVVLYHREWSPGAYLIQGVPTSEASRVVVSSW